MSEENKIVENNLAVIADTQFNAVEAFQPNGLDKLIEYLRDKANKEVEGLDISTKANRAKIISTAYALSKDKKDIGRVAEVLKEDHKKIIEAINAERDRGVEELQKLQDIIRKPVTDWEDKENDRLAGHEKAITEIEAMRHFVNDDEETFQPTSEEIAARIEQLQPLTARAWEEFEARAKFSHERVALHLTNLLTSTKQAEHNAAELKRLKAEEAIRIEAERIKKISEDAAAEATRKAKEEADRKAEELAAEVKKAADEAAEREKKAIQDKADADARAKKAEYDAAAEKKRADDAIKQADIDRRAAEQDAIEKAFKAKADADRIAKEIADKADEDRKAAAAKAEKDKADAVEAAAKKERDRLSKVAADAKAADDARAADEAHRGKINREALAALLKLPENALMPEEQAKAIIIAITKGMIPHVSIKY